jgi:uncharacterized protein
MRHTYSGAAGAWSIPARAGIGLRIPHHAGILRNGTTASWLEVHAENYLGAGAHCEELERIAEDYPLSLHGIGLSLGSADGVDIHHLAHFKALVSKYKPTLVSDHMSWSRAGGIQVPDLLPLPYTDEALGILIRNVDRVQDFLKRDILLENPSTYFKVADSTSTEQEFLAELVQRTGCGVLLDINNVYVSACNQNIDPEASMLLFLGALPHESIQEIHLAGHSVIHADSGREIRIDDHGSPVCQDVWNLFELAIQIIGPRPTLIEWDNNLPTLDVLLREARTAQIVMDRQLKGSLCRGNTN